MTTAQAAIKKRVMRWSPSEKVHLAEQLLESVEDFVSPDIEAAWEKEIAARLNDFESGKTKGIPAKKVMAEARKTLHEIRRVSSTRRKRAD